LRGRYEAQSTRTTEPSLHKDLSATFRVDPRWNRAANPYPQRARSSRRPRGAKCMNTRTQKATASGDRAVFPPISPPSMVTPLHGSLPSPLTAVSLRDAQSPANV